MTPKQFEQLAEIRRLLKEAYDVYFARGDGHCKSSEGYIEVRYPNYFDRENYAPDEASSIGIYSYALGPSRMHAFNNFDEAVSEVRSWHAEQMASE